MTANRDPCHCGRPLIARHGDLEPTCGECRSKPGYCACDPIDVTGGERDNPPDLPDFDLAGLAAGGIAPPELICGDMLYKGGIHTIAGQPGGGKSTLMAWWMLRHIRDGGNVMLLDEEGGPEMVAEKFLNLGASLDELRPPRLSYIPFPARGWNLVDIEQLHKRLAERGPGVVAWDSAAEFLSIAGLDENAAADVTRFWKRVLKPCARDFGAAVVAIDHTGKGTEHGGYGRGSGAKKAASDVQYMLETVRPFNRTQDGILKLTTAPGKDRRGWLPAGYQIHVSVQPRLSLSITELGAGSETARDGLPPAQAKLLEAADGTPATVTELVDRIVAEHGHGLKRETVSRALNDLLKAGLVDRIDQGPGHAALWTRNG